MKKKLVRWFNDIRKGYIRLRFCERCGILTRKNHWSKADVSRPTKVVYGHIWLCHDCFYGQLLGLK
jgi:hypothetical protein